MVSAEKKKTNMFIDKYASVINDGKYGSNITFEIWPSNGLLYIKTDGSESATKLYEYMKTLAADTPEHYIISYADKNYKIIELRSRP